MSNATKKRLPARCTECGAKLVRISDVERECRPCAMLYTPAGAL